MHRALRGLITKKQMEKDKKKLYENECGFSIETVDNIGAYPDKSVKSNTEESRAYMVRIQNED